LPRFPSVARNDERRGKARLRVGMRVKSKKLSLPSSSPIREEEIITFSVLLAGEECGLPRFARNDGCEVTGLPRFPSVARNDGKRGKARLRVGTRVRFLSGGRQEVGTRVRFFAGGRKEVGTRVRFLSGGRKEVGTGVRFLSGRWQGVGPVRKVDCTSCFGRLQ